MTGTIQLDGKVVTKIYGSYLGFMEFDGIRYWDARDAKMFSVNKAVDDQLPSDSMHRPDLLILMKGDIETAQKRKEEMEELQRKDVKLRDDTKKKSKKNK